MKRSDIHGLYSFWMLSLCLIMTPVHLHLHTYHYKVQYKAKQSHYRPRQVLRVPGSLCSQILRKLAHEGCKVVSPTYWPPLPQEVFLVLNSVRGWADPMAIVQLEGLWQWKIPMTPSGIEPATFWLVAQCLNQLRYVVPPKSTVEYTKNYVSSFFSKYMSQWKVFTINLV
jgi:hypothetical protein